MILLRCQGCGKKVSVPAAGAAPVLCPQSGNGRDHVLLPELPLPSLRGDEKESQPLLRFADRMLAFHRCAAAGHPEIYQEIVRTLDARITALTGQSFACTPLVRSDFLSQYFGLDSRGGVWLKDDTQRPGGSHKGRHLFGAMVELLVGESLSLSHPSAVQKPLAIASCGNAALAAAVIARAAERPLLVFIPADAEPSVVLRLRELQAEITVCHRREGESGDPCYLRFLESVRAGAVPFCCQGTDNGLTIEGGQTLLAEALCELEAAARTPSRIVVQVGGGALASACSLAIETALSTGLLSSRPRFYTAQTTAVAPLHRAYQRLRTELGDALDSFTEQDWYQVAAEKRRYMWPWERVSASAAHGILDDETYDWLALVKAMARSGGRPLVIPEETILAGNALAKDATGIAVSATGSAGLAGLLHLHKEEPLQPDENVLCLFTGVMR